MSQFAAPVPIEMTEMNISGAVWLDAPMTRWTAPKRCLWVSSGFRKTQKGPRAVDLDLALGDHNRYVGIDTGNCQPG